MDFETGLNALKQLLAEEQAIDTLSDVQISGVADAHFLIYDSAVPANWKNRAISGDIAIDKTGVASINTGITLDSPILTTA
jgi:hypothetical protein